jgi:protein involved in polysaccharide export with SLBB domain
MFGRRTGLLAVLLAALLAGCQTPDDARVLQVLNQRGFGRPTQDANRQYYVGIGDSIVVRDTIHPEYSGMSETVRMDGVVTLSDVGEVYVNGLSPDEVTEVIRLAYSRYVNDTSGISVRVTGIQSKRYYVSGLPPNKPRAMNFRGDELLVDALIKAAIDEIKVDTENILVLRGDPENPLVISCNYEDIIERGLTRDNILIRENDIIYLTPSIVGWMTYGVSVLVAPLTPIQSLIFGYNNIISVTDSFGQGTVGFGNNKFNQGQFGGGQGQGQFP